MKNVSIALLGCGTVGKGVVDLLAMNGPLIEEQLNTKINIKRVLIRDLNKYEKMEDLPDSIQLTTDFNDIINDDEIDIVVEVMGSADFAKDCIEQCFLRGKSVISANKDLIADYGIPLLKLSQQHNVDFQFEASVAGGIPIVRPMYSSLNSNRIEEIIGIMNGTTNFILSNMTAYGSSYEDVLKEAQEKGYAEADPTNDVSGYDAARKIAILATLGFHSAVTFNDVHVEGIENISKEDIEHATEMGYVIKLLAIARQDEDGISLNVHSGLHPQRPPAGQRRRRLQCRLRPRQLRRRRHVLRPGRRLLADSQCRRQRRHERHPPPQPEDDGQTGLRMARSQAQTAGRHFLAVLYPHDRQQCAGRPGGCFQGPGRKQYQYPLPHPEG